MIRLQEDVEYEERIYNELYPKALDEAQRQFLLILRATIKFIDGSKNKDLAVMAVCHVLRVEGYEDITLTEINERLGVNPNAASSTVIKYKALLNDLNPIEDISEAIDND